MMILSTMLWILFAFLTVVNADLNYYIRFGKVPGNEIIVINLDLTSNTTYILKSGVLDRDGDSYNPSERPDFESSEETFAYTYSYTDGVGNSSVRGHFGTDYVTLPETINSPLRLKFGLITNISGADPTLMPEGIPVIGRAGLSLDGDFKKILFNGGRAVFCAASQCHYSQCGRRVTRFQWDFPEMVDHNITTSPLSANANGSWVLSSKGVSFGRYSRASAIDLVLSTASDYITVSEADFNAILLLIQATKREDGRYAVSCFKRDEGPRLVFTINGAEVGVRPEDYIHYQRGGCTLKIRPGASRNVWYAGAPFFDGLGLCFDYDHQTVNLFTLKPGQCFRNPRL